VEGIALGDFVNGVGDEVGWGILEQVAFDVVVEVVVDDLMDVGVGAESGEEDDSDIWGVFLELAGGTEAVHAGHSDIHEDDVGLNFFGKFDGFSSIICFSDDFEGGVCLKERAERLSEEGVVVDD